MNVGSPGTKKEGKKPLYHPHTHKKEEPHGLFPNALAEEIKLPIVKKKKKLLTFSSATERRLSYFLVGWGNYRGKVEPGGHLLDINFAYLKQPALRVRSLKTWT